MVGGGRESVITVLVLTIFDGHHTTFVCRLLNTKRTCYLLGNEASLSASFTFTLTL